MDWLDEVRINVKKNRQILFSRDSAYLQDLTALLDDQTHRAAVLWALELAEETAAVLSQRYPQEPRPRIALETGKSWAAGKVKMPEAKRAILNCHAFAKELSSQEDQALCHAIGQACGVVHTKGHALGYPLYELTALLRRHGVDSCREAVESRKRDYIERLLFWRDHEADEPREWADFLLK